jgi:diphthamide biosynthesis methyltransferase
VATNRREGLHTLCLLDIRVKEPTQESLARRVRRCAGSKQARR